MGRLTDQQMDMKTDKDTSRKGSQVKLAETDKTYTSVNFNFYFNL